MQTSKTTSENVGREHSGSTQDVSELLQMQVPKSANQRHPGWRSEGAARLFFVLGLSGNAEIGAGQSSLLHACLARPGDQSCFSSHPHPSPPNIPFIRIPTPVFVCRLPSRFSPRKCHRTQKCRSGPPKMPCGTLTKLPSTICTCNRRRDSRMSLTL